MGTSYTPPGLAVHIVEKIPALFDHSDTKIIWEGLKGRTFACVLPEGQIYFESKLALDTDGSPVYAPKDPTGRLDTAAVDAAGKPLDSDRINYFVLPIGRYAKFGIRKGDIGVVIYGIRMAYACFGDVRGGPSLGEGSIALHRELGHETIKDRHAPRGGKLINTGIDSGVITIVFPKSGNGRGRTNQESALIGKPLFESLKAKAAAFDALIDI